jgi:hypothetical protein
MDRARQLGRRPGAATRQIRAGAIESARTNKPALELTMSDAAESPMINAKCPAPLQLGWMLEALPARVPVNLKAEDLTAHTAIIAQSGSGKSFMLGRLLEEIISKTRARVFVLDPNSDFAALATVDPGAWENPKCKEWFHEKDTPNAFSDRWSARKFTTVSQRDTVAPISLAWHSLPLAEKARHLGLSLSTTLAEMNVLGGIEGFCKEHAPSFAGPFSLSVWGELAHQIDHSASASGASVGTIRNALGQLVPVPSYTSRPGEGKAVFNRVKELEALGIWDRGGDSIQQRTSAVCEGRTAVLCIDLGSLETSRQRDLAAAVALEALWMAARREWTLALAKPKDQDTRCPVFVVVDEAHNLAPEDPLTESAAAVNDALIRIAMEGRKYGLFLILVTQRPSRVNSNLLSQCDNLALMKMSNPDDVKLAEDRFGFIPRGWAERAIAFEQGQALLCGRFVDRPVFVKIAPRRTVEGGRSLRKEVWLEDPMS